MEAARLQALENDWRRPWDGNDGIEYETWVHGFQTRNKTRQRSRQSIDSSYIVYFYFVKLFL